MATLRYHCLICFSLAVKVTTQAGVGWGCMSCRKAYSIAREKWGEHPGVRGSSPGGGGVGGE